MHRIFQPANPYLMQKTLADNVHEPSYKCGYIFMHTPHKHTHRVHMCHPLLLPSILFSTHQLSFPPPPDLLIVSLTFLKSVINACSFIHFVPLRYVSHLIYTAETALTQPITVLETVWPQLMVTLKRKKNTLTEIKMIYHHDMFNRHIRNLLSFHGNSTYDKNGILKSSMSYIKYYFGSTCGSFGSKEIRAFFCFYHQRLFLYIYNRWEENSVFCNYSLL